MIIVVGYMQFDTAHLSTIMENARKMEATTRAEDGCLYYALALDDPDTGHMTIVEKWRDEEALNTHLRLPGLKAFLSSLMPHVKDFHAKLYDLSGERDVVMPD